MTETTPDAPATVSPYPFPYPITPAMLKAAGACDDGVKLFTKRFGDGPVIPIPALCERWASRFPWAWLASELMAWPEPVDRLAGMGCECSSCVWSAHLREALAVAGNPDFGKARDRVQARLFATLWAERGPSPELLAKMAAES